MASYEQAPPAELPCATCPNRPTMSRALARIGFLGAGESCTGPDVIDRFKVVKTEGLHSEPEGYDATTILSDASFNVPKKPPIVYSIGEHTREKHCPRDPIVLGSNEVVAEARPNEQGRVWVEIGEGSPEDVRQVKPPITWTSLSGDHRAPLEILQAIRRVTNM
jgi:hypothetical protein